MRRFVAVLALSIISLPALAEEKNPAPLSQEDQAKLKAELKQLGQAFGINPPKRPAPANKKDDQPAAEKTMADVADRALDMTGKLVGSISATLQKVAPEVWRIMIRQQYAKAFADTLLPWLLFAAALIYLLISIKYKLATPFSDGRTDSDAVKYIFNRLAPTLLMIAFGIWGCIALSCSIKYLVNPEYYAIRDLIVMLLNPSGASM